MRAKIGWLALAAAASGCSVQRLQTNSESRAEELFALTASWPAVAQSAPGEPPRGAVDVLFMIDDSSSMSALQQRLAAGFASFISIIDGLPGGTPDLHIGVVSSDMGVDDDSITGCNGEGGDRGALQFTARGSCTQTNLPAGAAYIALATAPDGSRVTNYGGALSDVFSCIALLGEQGCGFEQSLSSVRHALDPIRTIATNAGFLRRDAFLAVILVTNEDDCSAAPGVPLFDTTANLTTSSELGPPTNFRCNEFGHLCTINGALQHPPRTATGKLTGCESNESGSYLERVASFAGFLRGLKDDPAKVFVAAVAGPPAPYQVNVEPPAIGGDDPWPVIGHSCTAADGSFADPAVRLHQLTASLGPYGHFESICGPGAGGPLSRIAQLMTRPLAGSCVARPSSAATCQVVDRWVDGDGVKQAVVVPQCANTPGVTPCWSLVDDFHCATTEQMLSIDRGGAAMPAGLMTAIDCASMTLP
jgi:hypothetical protein